MDKLFKCACNSEWLRLQTFDDDEDLQECIISVIVSRNTQSLTFWQRVKFVFNRWCIHSEVVLSREEAENLSRELQSFATQK